MYLQTILIKPASSQCNMSCDYCFYCDEAAKREYGSYGMMSEETLRSLIKKSLFQAVSDISRYLLCFPRRRTHFMRSAIF